jgi:hypothetical protein
VRERGDEVKSAVGASDKWDKMKSVWVEAAEKVVGKTKGKARHKETWWWNEEVEKAVEVKRVRFKNWVKSKTEEDLHIYRTAKRDAKRIVATAKADKRADIIADMKMKEQPSQIFRVAKRMAREREDISGVNCLRDSGGSLNVDEEGIKEA